MAFVGKVASALVSPIGSLLFGGGQKAAPAPSVIAPVTPTRNAAADAARNADLLRRRRGSAANDVTGGGAEAVTPGAKTLLGG